MYSFRVQQSQRAELISDHVPLAFQGFASYQRHAKIQVQRPARHPVGITMEELAKTPANNQEFSLKQYNVFSGWKGDNTKPSMLQGAEISREQREAVFQLQNDTVFDWSAHRVLLLKEMFADSPDILTLQDLDMYAEFFTAAFEERGYGSLHAKRIGEQDGIAIVFKHARFRLLAASERFHLPSEGDHTPLHHPGSNSTVADDVKEDIMHKSRNMRDKGGYGQQSGLVAVFALLQDRTNPQQKVMVGTTHLDKGPENPLKSLTRIKQMSVLNVIQEYLAKKWGVSLDNDIVIIAADLNTDRHEESMVKRPALAGADYRFTNMTLLRRTGSSTTMIGHCNMWFDYIFHAGQAEVAETNCLSDATQPIPNWNQGCDHVPATAKFRWRKLSAPSPDFIIPNRYNYSRSTADNYAAGQADEASLVGEFTEVRKVIDYAYHRVYQKERQLLQDRIVRNFLYAPALGSHFDVAANPPSRNWIVFTAGGMGSGKSYTLNWLANRTYFPLNAFVCVDPDEIRASFPESTRYKERDGATYGNLTQKEAGYIAEILTGAALKQDKPVLVDGSLHQYEWYLKYFGILRESHPGLKIGIIHVNTSVKSQYERVQRRAKIDGRFIPDKLLKTRTRLTGEGLSVLVPHSDFFASIDNEGEVPRLSRMVRGLYDAETEEFENATWENFRAAWAEQIPSLSETFL